MSTEGSEHTDLHYELVASDNHERAPLVLLHGSGATESFSVNLARRMAPERAAFALRGRVPWEDGFAFFRRNADRTLDQHDLLARCSEFCDFLQRLNASTGRNPILVGYSNGAIMAAAAVLHRSTLTSGLILLRPLSPTVEESFPALPLYPVLLIGGSLDDRRHPSDTPTLAGQFMTAGAIVTACVAPIGHQVEEMDIQVSRAWLAGQA